MFSKLPLKTILLTFVVTVSFIFNFSSILTNPVSAETGVEKTLKYTYTFSEDKNANVKFEASIDNNNAGNLLKSYVFNLTEGGYENLKAYVNNSEVSVNKLSLSSNRFQINFSPEVSRLKSDILVRIEYRTSELIDQYGNLLNLYIPYVKRNSQMVNVSYVVNYPSSWGSVNFASMRGYQLSSESDRTIITINSLTNVNGGYFSIGDNQYFDFKISYDEIKAGTTNEKIALNIPQTSLDQELYFYTPLDVRSTILVDQYDNQFIRYLSPNSINLGMQIVKSLSGQRVTRESTWRTLYYTDETNLQLKKYYEDNFSKVESNKDLVIFDKITSDFKYKQTEISANLPIGKILSQRELNSLEFSVLLSNLYNLSGYKARVVGGIYMGGDNLVEIGSNVWFWVEYVGENGLVREVDPSLASITGYDYFTNDGLNHIKVFNFADPLVNLSFGNKLQLPSEYKISAIDDISFENNVKESVLVTNDLITKGQKVIYSGTENKSVFTIKNTSNKVLNISRILIGNDEIELNLETSDGYRKLLFPSEEMTFNYSLKEPEWGYNGEKTYNVKVYATLLGNEELIYSENYTFIYEASELVILFSWILKLLLSIILVTCIYVSYKYARKMYRKHKLNGAQIDKRT